MPVRRWLAFFVIALLVGSFTSLASGSISGNEISQEKAVAEKLINNLKRLAGFAEVRVPENMTNSTYYLLAKEHYSKALSEFNEGNYNASMVDALMAMHYYRLVPSELKVKVPVKARSQLRARVERTRAYLVYTERLIKVARERDLNVTNASRLYNETLDAFKLVLESMRSGNMTKAREDYAKALEKKAQLDEALRELRLQMLHQNSEKIVERFLARSERAIELARTLNETSNPKLMETYNEFLALYRGVKVLSDEGKWDEALNLIIEKRDIIQDFQMALRRAAKWKHCNFTGDIEKIRELHGRIIKDGRELMKLKREGLDVSKAEVQLRAAMNEYKLGLRLLRNGHPQKAKEHFETALALLREVEVFMGPHS